MKKRFSLTIDEQVYDTLRIQAQILDIPLSRHINKILREKLELQDEQILEAIRRLERQRESEH